MSSILRGIRRIGSAFLLDDAVIRRTILDQAVGMEKLDFDQVLTATRKSQGVSGSQAVTGTLTEYAIAYGTDSNWIDYSDRASGTSHGILVVYLAAEDETGAGSGLPQFWYQGEFAFSASGVLELAATRIRATIDGNDFDTYLQDDAATHVAMSGAGATLMALTADGAITDASVNRGLWNGSFGIFHVTGLTNNTMHDLDISMVAEIANSASGNVTVEMPNIRVFYLDLGLE